MWGKKNVIFATTVTRNGVDYSIYGDFPAGMLTIHQVHFATKISCSGNVMAYQSMGQFCVFFLTKSWDTLNPRVEKCDHTISYSNASIWKKGHEFKKQCCHVVNFKRPKQGV